MPLLNEVDMPSRPFRRMTRRPSLLRPSRLAVWQLDDRIVPAGTVTGTLFRDFNADGVFDNAPRTIPNDGGGAVGVSQDAPYSATAVAVRAYDSTNLLVGTASPGLTGQYTLNLTGTGPYRIEFSNLPAGFNYGPAGATNVVADQGAGTAVQFVPDGGASGVNLGLVRPGEVTADNPLLATSQFVYGGTDQANRNVPVVQAFPYSSGRTVGDAVAGDSQLVRPDYARPQTHSVSISHGTVGSVWGLGYDSVGRQLLMAAYYKRHSGYGPGGPGAIYTAAAPAAGGVTTAASLLLNLNTAADPGNTGGQTAAGATYRPTVTPNADYYLTDGLTRSGAGATARDLGWDSVGKEGLGGVDVSADGRFAYTVGLNNRRLYVIDLTSLAVRSYTLPTPVGATGAGGSDLRPFAVTVFNGQVYIGAVNTAESLYDSSRPTFPAAGSADEVALTAARAALRGYVFRFDPTANPVGGGGRFVDTAGTPATGATAANFAFDLNYGRSYAHPGRDRTTTADDLPATWRPWSAVYRNVQPTPDQLHAESAYPQPMLTGLAFDSDGSLVVGLRDRAGDEFGAFTPADPTNPTLNLYGIPAGDLLRAAPAVAGGWVLESNGTVGGVTTGLPAGVAAGSPGAATVSGVGNGQGPGGGEFYSGDYLVPSPPGTVPNPGPQQEHTEVFVGGVLQIPGAPDVATTAFDPAQVAAGFNSGGVRWLQNAGPNAGTLDKAYELYVANFNPGAVPFTPPPLFAKTNGIGDLVALNDTSLEIGNRVWRDVAKNGLQDANEPGIGGLTVVLYSGSTALATTTTAADGSYLFSDKSAPANPVAGRAYGVPLRSGASYSVRIPLAQAPLAGYEVTTFQAPLPAGAAASIQLAEVNSDAQPVAGEAVINVGALAAAGANHTYDAGFSLIPTLNFGDYVWNDTNNNGLFDSVETGIAGVTVNLLDAGGTTIGVATTTGQGGYLFTGLPAGQYRVQIPAGQTALTGLVSSSGTNGSQTGTFEPATGEPTNGANNSDHGVLRGAFVVGPLVTLALGAAPTLETTVAPNDLGLSDGVIPDANSDRTQDFGFYQPLSVGDTVWIDPDNNGVRTAGENPLAGVSVQLLDAAGATVGTTTTNGNGGYLFQFLQPGPYTVRLVRNSVLAGYSASTGGTPAANPPVNDRSAGTQSAGFIASPQFTLARGGAVLADAATQPAGLPGDALTPAANRFRNVDFGVFPLLSLGDLVFVDANNNCFRDNGEAAVPGVPVELLDAGGAVLASTTTDANGLYLFSGLLPGEYRVRITPPAGYLSSSGTNGSPTGPCEPVGSGGIPGGLVNDRDNGVTQPNGQIITSLVSVSATNLAFDFGLYQPLSVGDRVWVDANNNGSREAGESALPGVTVQLLDAAGATVGVATTNAQGGYLFTNLAPGDYTVRLVRDGVLTGYSSSTGNVRPPVNDRDVGVEEAGFITSGAVSLALGGAPAVDAGTIPTGLPADPAPTGNRYRNVDFGVFQPLSLGDLVWSDLNNDGQRQAAEPGLGGVVVTLVGLDAQNAGTQTATTQADGGYLFTNLVGGRYQVVIPLAGNAALAGLRSSTGTNGSATGAYEPAPAGAVNNQDHGTQGASSVAGPVVNLQPGTAPTGEGNSAPSLTDLAADASSDRTQDFGFFRPLSLGDLVWEDANNNGVRDAGEPGLGGVTVILRSVDSPSAPTLTTTTAADGGYLFTNLVAARYQVVVATPGGYQTSTGLNGSLTGPYEAAPAAAGNNQDHGTAGTGTVTGPVVVLAAGTAPTGEGNTAPKLTDPAADADSDRTQDFGFYRPLSLGDLVFRDNNTDGVFNTGDAGIAGATVRLRDASGAVIGTTTTGADGRYGFGNLAPGDYSVQILPPTGLVNTTAAPAAQPANDQNRGVTQPDGTISAAAFTLSAFGSAANPDGGTANLRQDFGLRTPAAAISSLGGTVYLDNNLSGTLDAGERGIPDVRVLLDGVTTGGTRVTRELFTDGNGQYLFTGLPAGTYVVREQTPTGTLYNGATNVGSQGGTGGLDVTTGINLPAGVAATSYNFGEFQPASTFGYVWLDTNSNGVFDSGESPIPGVPVTVGGTAFAGSPFARPLAAADVPGGLTAVTGPNGRYDFVSLPPGVYSLAETQPDYFNSGEQNGDPYGPAVGVALNAFSGVSLTPTQIRGPFNFGERLGSDGGTPGRSPQTPTDPTKREFLSTTAASRRSSAASGTGSDQDIQTVSPVARLNLQASPTPLNRSGNIALLATGAAFGASPVVRVFDASAGVERFRFLAYEQNYTGGVATAVGDVDGDGIPDIVTAVAFGGGPRVRVFSGKDASVLQDYYAYESTFTGGLNLAVGDVNGDGRADIITGTNQGGGPRVRVFDGKTGAVLQDYFAFDQVQRGGVRVAAADFNKDGRDDIAVTTGMGMPTRVRVFDAVTATSIIDFAPFEAGFTGGATIAAGDFNGDGVPDLTIGADAGGGPRVTVYSGRDQSILVSFFAFEQTFTGGVRVSAIDADGNGTADIVAAAGTGGTGRVTIYSGPGLGVLQDFFANDVDQPNGVYVGSGATPRKAAVAGGTPAAVGALNRAGALTDLPVGFASSVTT